MPDAFVAGEAGHGRTAARVLREVVTRVNDAAGHTRTYSPNGDWYLETDTLTRKVWTGYETRISITTSLIPTGGWQVYEAPTLAATDSGRDAARVELTDGPSSRPTAFRSARSRMNDIAANCGSNVLPDGGDQDEPHGVTIEDLKNADLSGYDDKRQFGLDIAVAVARAHNSHNDVVDTGTVAGTLQRWRSTMSGRVVLPITLSPADARKRRDEFDQRHGEVAQVRFPITEKLIHDLDAQIEHIENLNEEVED